MLKWPELNNDDVLVFLSRDPGYTDDKTRAFYLSVLSEDEQCKYHKFHFDKDRRLYLLSHALLRMCLAHYGHCSEKDIRFSNNDYGKPFLLNDPRLRFNLSHAHQAMAITVHRNYDLALGIDIENHSRQGEYLNLAFHYFSEKECHLLNQYPTSVQEQVFFKFWTLKESYIKAIGKGLSLDLSSFSFGSLEKNISIDHCHDKENQKFWRFFQSFVYDKYLLALAIRSSVNVIDQLDIATYEYLPSHEIVSLDIKYHC